MREVSYRVWDLQRKKMYKPSVLGWRINEEYDCLMFYLNTMGADGVSGGSERFILMQSTGLKDKNGVKIYEGDILDAGDRVVQVVWHDSAGAWDTDFISYKNELNSNGLANGDWKFRTKVIGNIYENPELLK